METIDEALGLLKRQAELEAGIRLPGELRLTEEQELQVVRRRLANFPEASLSSPPGRACTASSRDGSHRRRRRIWLMPRDTFNLLAFPPGASCTSVRGVHRRLAGCRSRRGRERYRRSAGRSDEPMNNPMTPHKRILHFEVLTDAQAAELDAAWQEILSGRRTRLNTGAEELNEVMERAMAALQRIVQAIQQNPGTGQTLVAW